jgi:hypothetical protein
MDGQEIHGGTAGKRCGKRRKEDDMNRHFWRVLAALMIASFALHAVPARAEMEVSELLDEYDAATPDEGAIIEKVVYATQNGIDWANAYQTTQRQQPLYCPPDHLLLSGHELLEMLRKDASVASDPYGMALLEIMQKTYPCPAKSE